MSESISDFVNKNKKFPPLISPEKASVLTNIPKQRLISLAKSGVTPCIWFGEKLMFHQYDIVMWSYENYCRIQHGRRVESEFKLLYTKRSTPEDIPEILQLMSGRLKDLDYCHKTPCIYFLLQEGVIVYVGMSTSLQVRISSHSQDKIFDRVLYLDYHDSNIEEVEASFIRYLKPKYNRDEADKDVEEVHLNNLRNVNFLKVAQSTEGVC